MNQKKTSCVHILSEKKCQLLLDFKNEKKSCVMQPKNKPNTFKSHDIP